MSKKIIELEDLEIRRNTPSEDAILVSDGEKTAWLPKSMIEIHDDGAISLPEWLAIEKELI